jgi:nucleoside-diphosphate-sugar epimerase
MSHLILGSGPVGLATAAALAARSLPVVLVSRHAPPRLPPGVRHAAVDVLDAARLREAAAGARVVVQCLNAPYHRWAKDFPPLQTAAVDLARHLGARLVSFENLYPYGLPRVAPFAEADGFAPCSEKGRVRAALATALAELHRRGELEVAQVRASDLFGPGMHASALGDELFARACQGKQPRLLGDPDAPHTWTYVADAGETLARVAIDPATSGRAWHVPSAPPLSQREVVERVGRLLGRTLEPQQTPRLVLRLVGLLNPAAGALVEMLYEFERPFVMSDAATRAALGQAHTPLDAALAATVAAFTPPAARAASSTATPAPR